MVSTFITIADEGQPRNGEVLSVKQLPYLVYEDESFVPLCLALEGNCEDGRPRTLKEICIEAGASDIWLETVIYHFRRLREERVASGGHRESSGKGGRRARAVMIADLEQKSTRMAEWMDGDDLYKLLFLRSGLRVMMGNRRGALLDLETISGNHKSLGAFVEFDYLCRHNRAVLQILLEEGSGFSILADIVRSLWQEVLGALGTKKSGGEKGGSKEGGRKGQKVARAQPPQDGSATADASIDVPDLMEEAIEELPDDEGTKGTGAKADSKSADVKQPPSPPKQSLNILPTLVSCMEIKSILDRLDERYVPEDFKEITWSQLPGLMDEYWEYMDRSDWASDILPWFYEKEPDSIAKGFGLALFLDSRKDHREIASCLSEIRAAKESLMESCCNSYFEVFSAPSPAKALEKFLYAEKRQKSLDTNLRSAEFKERFRSAAHQVEKEIKRVAKKFKSRLDSLETKVSSDERIVGTFLVALKEEKDALVELNDRIAAYVKSGDNRSFSTLEALAERWRRSYFRARIVFDMLDCGYMMLKNAEQRLSKNDFRDVRAEMDSLAAEWEKRLASSESPWMDADGNLDSWRYWGICHWKAFAAEFVIHLIGKANKEGRMPPAWEGLPPDLAKKRRNEVFHALAYTLDGLVIDADGMRKRAIRLLDDGDEFTVPEDKAFLREKRFFPEHLRSLGWSLLEKLYPLLRGDADEILKNIKSDNASLDSIKPFDIPYLGDRMLKKLEREIKWHFPPDLTDEKDESVQDLFAMFERYCPEDVAKTRLDAEFHHLVQAEGVLDRLKSVKDPQRAGISQRRLRQYEYRLKAMYGWRILNMVKDLSTAGRETLSDAWRDFEEACTFVAQPHLALWGKAHVIVSRTSLDIWVQDALLAILVEGKGLDDFDAVQKQEVLYGTDKKEPEDIASYESVTRERYSKFVEAVKRLEQGRKKSG